MASITVRICKDGTESYRVLIRKKGVYKCKTFKCKKAAIVWSLQNDPK
jgi:hypothetical protein